MRIDIKFASCLGNHPIDLSLSELDSLRNADELLIKQEKKVLQIMGNADELELLAAALLNKAIKLRRLKA